MTLLPWRKNQSTHAIGSAGQLVGVLLIVIGSIDLIRQFATGVALENLEWPVFILVGGIGLGFLFLGPALAFWAQQATDEPIDYEDGGTGLDDDIADDGGD